MPLFPTEESEIVALARKLAIGFEANAELFANPPVSCQEMKACAEALVTAKERELAAHKNFDEATRQLKTALESLVEKTKINLSYAETVTQYDDAKLKAIGWGGRKPERLLPPSAPRALELVKVSDGLVELDWKRPSDGGKPQNYRIEAREAGEGRWALKGFSLHSDCLLKNLEAGKTYELRVIASNAIGDSEPSDSITISV